MIAIVAQYSHVWDEVQRYLTLSYVGPDTTYEIHVSDLFSGDPRCWTIESEIKARLPNLRLRAVRAIGVIEAIDHTEECLGRMRAWYDAIAFRFICRVLPEHQYVIIAQLQREIYKDYGRQVHIEFVLA